MQATPLGLAVPLIHDRFGYDTAWFGGTALSAWQHRNWTIWGHLGHLHPLAFPVPGALPCNEVIIADGASGGINPAW